MKSKYYPVFLDLKAKKCVVIGGGEIAERKIEQLLASHGDVTVVSPESTSTVEVWAETKQILLLKRMYQKGDLEGAFLAIAATDNSEVNGQVRAEAEEEKTLINVADVPELCDFIAPAITSRGPVTVAISTSGTSPALARRLRELMEKTRSADNPHSTEHWCRCLEWARAAEVLAAVRQELKAVGKKATPDAWQGAMDNEFLGLVTAGKFEAAHQELFSKLSEDAANQSD